MDNNTAIETYKHNPDALYVRDPFWFKLIKDISKHFNRKPIEIIDRKEAIGKAIDIANKDDLVIVDLKIIKGRHPVIEQQLESLKNYIPKLMMFFLP